VKGKGGVAAGRILDVGRKNGHFRVSKPICRKKRPTEGEPRDIGFTSERREKKKKILKPEYNVGGD